MTNKRPYYGDQSSESFYAGGLYERKKQRREKARWPSTDHHLKKCQSWPTKASQSNKAVLEAVSGNSRRKTFLMNDVGKGSKRAFGKNHTNSEDDSRLSLNKKLKTIPQPIVHIDPQEEMHLLLVEGSFPHGVDRLNYLSNVYYECDSSLLPHNGRCFDVLPPTKMASGPWILVTPSGDSRTLGDQRDWAGRRIRFASPKAASAKSLQHFRISPTEDDLVGSLTVAAFTGFCTHDEFRNQEEALARKVLERNKYAEWSNPVARLPPFVIDNKLKCAGGFSIAVDLDPNVHSYYLKIGICETLNEVLCVELVFPLRYKETPNSASTIGPPLTSRNLGIFEETLVASNSDKMIGKSEPRNSKSNAPWKFDVETFSVSYHRDRIFSPCEYFPTQNVTVESSLQRKTHDFHCEKVVDADELEGVEEASVKTAGLHSPSSYDKSVSNKYSSKLCQIQRASQMYDENLKAKTNAEATDLDFFDAFSQPQLDDNTVMNPVDENGKGANFAGKAIFLVAALCFLIICTVFQGSATSLWYRYVLSTMTAITSHEWTTRSSWNALNNSFETPQVFLRSFYGNAASCAKETEAVNSEKCHLQDHTEPGPMEPDEELQPSEFFSGTPHDFTSSIYGNVDYCAMDMDDINAETCHLYDPMGPDEELQPSKFNKEPTNKLWRSSVVTFCCGFTPALALALALRHQAATTILAWLGELLWS